MTEHYSQIASAEQALRLAMLEGNASKLDTLIADDLLFIGPDGSILSKAQDIELHRSGEQRISQLDVLTQEIRVKSGVGSVSIEAVMAGVFKGQAFVGRFRYLRVWQQTPSGWKIIAGSVAALPHS
jgi:hypothetical protein